MGDGAGLSDWGLLAGLRFFVGYASGVPFGLVPYLAKATATGSLAPQGRHSKPSLRGSSISSLYLLRSDVRNGKFLAAVSIIRKIRSQMQQTISLSETDPGSYPFRCGVRKTKFLAERVSALLRKIRLFLVCFFIILLGAVKVIAENSPAYPPAGFEKEKPITKSAAGTFRIEQWVKVGAGRDGGQLYQTWIVPVSGSPFKLPEVVLSNDSQSVEDSGNVGFPSDFSISPDNNYLFREQKVCRGNNGAYLYKRDSGINYKVLVPHLEKDASQFFSKLTGLKWDNGSGIVELSEWTQSGNLVLTLRGYSVNRKYGIIDWRCIFSPSTSVYSVPEAWIQKNKKSIRAN